jgi:hypothetical protein
MALSDGANREILRMSKMAGVRDIILRSSPGKNIQERRTSKSRTQTCLDRMKDFGSELDFEPYEAIDTSRSGAPLELEPPLWRVFPRWARVSETPMLSETTAQLQKINIWQSYHCAVATHTPWACSYCGNPTKMPHLNPLTVPVGDMAYVNCVTRPGPAAWPWTVSDVTAWLCCKSIDWGVNIILLLCGNECGGHM